MNSRVPHNDITDMSRAMCHDCCGHVAVIGGQCLYCRGMKAPITEVGRFLRWCSWYANPMHLLLHDMPELNGPNVIGPTYHSRIIPNIPRRSANRYETSSKPYSQTRAMTASVIIPAYNAAATIGEQLTALAAQQSEMPWEVVVVDNGSSDGTADVVRGYASRVPGLRVISGTGKQSAGYARNRGAESAAGDILLFCDADDIVASNWLQGMMTALQAHRFVGCRYDWDTLNPRWTSNVLGTPQAQGPQRITFLPYLCGGGGGLGVHRTVHEAVGGFDENIAFLEDIDYCQRIQQTGVPLGYASDAVVSIRRPATVSGIYTQARNWARYEQLLFKRYGGARATELWRWRAFAHDTLQYVKRLPRLLRTPDGQALSAWRLGRQVGCMEGCLKYKVAPITGY